LRTDTAGGVVGLACTRLAAEADLLGHRAAAFRVTLGNHRIVGLQAIAFAIFRRGHAMRREMTAQGLVRLAIDHRDDVILRRQRLTRRDGRRIFGRGLRLGRRTGRAKQCRHGIVHLSEKGGHVFGRSTGIGVAEPSNRQFGC